MGSNMNVMQSLADFKQSLQPAHSAAAGPADTTTGSTSTSDSDSVTITANDFLQLLVAEMKNQDPTADQDPNAYIDQLVQVNSLQQLIAINQDLSGLGTSSGSSGAGSSTSATGSSTASAAGGPTTAASAGATATMGHRPSQHASRELGTAAGTPAASVATALAPRPTQPEQAPIAGTRFHPGLSPAVPPVAEPSPAPAAGVGLGAVVSRLL